MVEDISRDNITVTLKLNCWSVQLLVGKICRIVLKFLRERMRRIEIGENIFCSFFAFLSSESVVKNTLTKKQQQQPNNKQATVQQ